MSGRCGGIPAEPDKLAEGEERIFQDGKLQAIGDAPAFLEGVDQPGLTQNIEVSGHGRLGHVKPIRDRARRHRPLSEQFEDLPARGIGESFENRVHEMMFS